MKRIPQLFCLIVVITASSLAVMAQDPMSPAKRKLIAEFIAVSKFDKQMDQVMDVLFATQDLMYAETVKKLVDRRTDLTPKQKETLELSMIERSKTFSAKFRERLPAAVNFADYIEQSVYPVYDKAFTENELADLVAFYKSATGQKVLVMMPQLMTESMEIAQRVLIPKITKLVDDITAEEMEDMKTAPRAPKKN
jgi:hypothetical protein